MNISDQELLAQIAHRDSEAMEEFYERFAPRVLGFLVKWHSSRNDAEEVMQEVFWQIWNQADRYDARCSPPMGWVYVIARSRSLDFLKSQKPHISVTNQALEADGSDALAKWEATEEYKRVKHALCNLPEQQRTAVSLAFLTGLSHREVAERLSLPLGTVKSQIRLGIRRLRNLLQEGEA